MNDYQVRTDIYNGPMDLLLYLIRRDEIDIYDIPLAQVTQTYCEYVALLQTIDPNIAGDFLVMAATLMEMKSRMLLPRQVTEDGEPEDLSDPRLELVRQLLEYKKFKDASFELGNSAHEQSMKWPRIPVKIKMQDAGEVDLEDVQIWDLVGAFNKLMSSIGARRSTHDVVFDDTPISLHAADVVDRLVGEGGEMRFESIFEGRNKVEMIGLFLALLELMRQRRVQVTQRDSFSSINIKLLSTDPIQVGDGVDSVLSETDEEQDRGAEQNNANEPETLEPEVLEPEVLEAGDSQAEVSDAAEPEGSEESQAVSEKDDGSSEGKRTERRAPRKHWREPLVSLDLEQDELFAELDQIKTNFDINEIIKESKLRGRKKTEDSEADATQDADAAENGPASDSQTESDAEASADADQSPTPESIESELANDSNDAPQNNESDAESSIEEAVGHGDVDAGTSGDPTMDANAAEETVASTNDIEEGSATLDPSVTDDADEDNSNVIEASSDDESTPGKIIASNSAAIEHANEDEPTLQPHTESDPS